MVLRHGKLRTWRSLFSSAVVLAGLVPVAQAQVYRAPTAPIQQTSAPCVSCPSSVPVMPGSSYIPGTPLESVVPEGSMMPGGSSSMDGSQPITSDSGASSDLAAAPEESSSVGGGYFTASNYIDSAIPRTQMRLRFDSVYDINRPDRGEFFYPKCGCFNAAGLGPANGPPLPETNINSAQYYQTYLEYAWNKDFSTFIEVPIVAIDPQVNLNTSGIGDINAGFKLSLYDDEKTFFTFQFRTYVPTADGTKGLGTEHVSLEPALLLYKQLAPKLFFEGEVRDWIAVGGSNFAGNVLRYGAGLSVLAYQGCNFRVQPVAEVVGWTFLSGQESGPDIPPPWVSAKGDTIVNGKLGVRFGFGNLALPGIRNQSDIGISYGRALTGEVLYKDIIRAELRLRF